MTDALEYNPPSPPVAALVLLHGLGASGADLYPLAGILLGGQMRVICPDAPMRAVSVNGGMRMRAWYDIAGADLESRQDLDGARESAEIVNALIAGEESRGMPSEKIFVGGFSQGAALALYAGQCFDRQLAGIIALSGYMLGGGVEQNLARANQRTPVFQAHGKHDSIVLLEWARQCEKQLKSLGSPVEYLEYEAAHEIPPETIADLNLWLAKAVKAPA